MEKTRIVPTFLVILSISFLSMSSATIYDAPNEYSISPNQVDIEVIEAFPNLVFSRPVDFQINELHPNRIYIVEQAGKIIFFNNSEAVTQTTVFLDHSFIVDDTSNEQGLLGFAFHPNYSQNGFFFIHYTVDGKSRISRFTTDPNTQLAISNSEEIILEVSQPYDNHNAGQIAFGPDGYLYIGFGDGGSSGDPLGHGQDLTTLLGSIVRIDVDSTPDPALNYKIPTDNPFFGQPDGVKWEIYAYGLRNPWRFSFDSLNGNLWLGDVGQNALEEIDLITPGNNYGWKTMEGTQCFSPSTNCNQTGLALPVVEYNRSLGYSVTGGYVYRGNSANLFGKYVFADYGSGLVMTLDTTLSSPIIMELIDTNLFIPSFGVDQNQELYILAFDGKIYKFSGNYFTETITTTTTETITQTDTQTGTQTETQTDTTSLGGTSTVTEISTIISYITATDLVEIETTTITSKESLPVPITFTILSILFVMKFKRLKRKMSIDPFE